MCSSFTCSARSFTDNDTNLQQPPVAYWKNSIIAILLLRGFTIERFQRICLHTQTTTICLYHFSFSLRYVKSKNEITMVLPFRTTITCVIHMAHSPLSQWYIHNSCNRCAFDELGAMTGTVLGKPLPSSRLASVQFPRMRQMHKR